MELSRELAQMNTEELRDLTATLLAQLAERDAKFLECDAETRVHEPLLASGDQTSAVEAQPLIAVRDVRSSSRWYSELLGADPLPVHGHRDFYDRISRSGRLLLQLHAWDEEDHPNLVNAGAAPVGHGVVLWFQVGDFDGAVKRASRLKAQVLAGPMINPAPRHREIWLRDPDGFVVVIASPDGECAL